MVTQQFLGKVGCSGESEFLKLGERQVQVRAGLLEDPAELPTHGGSMFRVFVSVFPASMVRFVWTEQDKRAKASATQLTTGILFAVRAGLVPHSKRL
mmetsp:Transcript_6133/g.13760  ORF Transcript_6133/g.13760 Transcript_6133/m.13760 type:complete len:97 (+) Transcript_6133:163-453(+)